MNFAALYPEMVGLRSRFLYNENMNNRRLTGGGGTRGRGVAGDIMRFEIQKNGKLPAADRYKLILKKKMEENKKALDQKTKSSFSIFNVKEARKMSKKAEDALKQVAARKAAKEAKAMRQMVVVQPRTYPTGTLDRKGQIFDVAGNIVAKVNTKNGKISTLTGWGLGKYKPKSIMTDLLVQDTISKFSPYFIQQRKLQMLQQSANVHGTPMDEVINVYGRTAAPADGAAGDGIYSTPGAMGPRQNIGATAWGARSDNVWGTYADNAWGQSADNVWGGNSTDVWGGVGVGGLWGQKGPNIWGTGNGRNYLRGISSFIMALFGLSNKENREKLRGLRASRTSGGGSTRSASTPRSGR
jgi:hypothetical protein